jgi:hypothetical protein
MSDGDVLTGYVRLPARKRRGRWWLRRDYSKLTVHARISDYSIPFGSPQKAMCGVLLDPEYFRFQPDSERYRVCKRCAKIALATCTSTWVSMYGMADPG